MQIKEKLITVGFFTGIFLPVRLLFYSFVSEVWIGSFGMITGVLLVVMYLAHKNKLGKIGEIINRQIQSFSKSKIGLFSILYLLFVVYLYSMVIYGVEHPPEEMISQFTEVLHEEGINDLQSATEKSNNIGWSGPAASYGILFSILVLLVPNKIAFALYSILNDWTNGWLIHFATVFLIESLEALGLIFYFRFRKTVLLP